MDTPTMIWMVIVLKLPIVAALLLVWYAVRDPGPAVDDDTEGGGGSDRAHAGGPRHPRPPRRGPHVTPEPGSPRRVRTARGRAPERVH